MGNSVKVLSIDGGGIRGIIPATILDRIEKLTREPISQLFDLIAGTSTGGILALGLSKPASSGQPEYSAEQMACLYREQGPVIFSRSLWHRVTSLDNLCDEKYPSTGIDTVLGQCFGETRLREALTDILVTSYEIEKNFPFFFKSSAARRMPDHDFPMRDIARATSAAPTYFEPLKLTVENTNEYYTLIDGGVYANNPAACAYVEARTTHPEADRITMVSIGTGDHSTRIAYEQARNWGLAQWARPILNVVFDGASSTVDYQLRQLLPAPPAGPPDYYRFQPSLRSSQISFDNVSAANLDSLQSLANEYIEHHAASIEALCKTLQADSKA